MEVLISIFFFYNRPFILVVLQFDLSHRIRSLNPVFGGSGHANPIKNSSSIKGELHEGRIPIKSNEEIFRQVFFIRPGLSTNFPGDFKIMAVVASIHPCIPGSFSKLEREP